MRAISIVGLVFIPFGTITSIFGTQFFTPAANGRHMSVNPDVWILFVIAIPITLISLAIWVASERNDKYNHGQSYTHDQNHGHGHKQHHNFNLSLGLSLSNTYNYIPRLLELLSRLPSITHLRAEKSSLIPRHAATTPVPGFREKPVDDMNRAELGILPPSQVL